MAPAPGRPTAGSPHASRPKFPFPYQSPANSWTWPMDETLAACCTPLCQATAPAERHGPFSDLGDSRCAGSTPPFVERRSRATLGKGSNPIARTRKGLAWEDSPAPGRDPRSSPGLALERPGIAEEAGRLFRRLGDAPTRWQRAATEGKDRTGCGLREGEIVSWGRVRRGITVNGNRVQATGDEP